MKQLISFSGGVESRTMAVLFGNKADAVFADTGAEHEIMYKELDIVEEKIRAFHGNDFKIIRLKPDPVGTSETGNLMEYIRFAKFFPNFGARYCTKFFKIFPINKYLKQFDQVEIMIGLNADEEGLRTGNHGLAANVTYTYPLIEHGIGRRMCYEILDAAGLRPQFPVYMQRGGCKCCYFKSKKEYSAMALLSPKEYDEVAELEQEIQDKRDKFFHLVTNIPSLKDFKARAQSVLFEPGEIYATVNDVTNCGVFCNR